jgi:hypothetical protein
MANHKGDDLLMGGVITIVVALIIGLCWKVIPLFLNGKNKKELAEIEARKKP